MLDEKHAMIVCKLYTDGCCKYLLTVCEALFICGKDYPEIKAQIDATMIIYCKGDNCKGFKSEGGISNGDRERSD